MGADSVLTARDLCSNEEALGRDWDFGGVEGGGAGLRRGWDEEEVEAVPEGALDDDLESFL